MTTRDDFITLLAKKFPNMMLRTTEEFDGSVGGIWTSGEESPIMNGLPIYHYYSESKQYDLGVLIKFENLLNKHGWFSQWNDCGTIMMYIISYDKKLFKN